jgi:hypothetical protein
MNLVVSPKYAETGAEGMESWGVTQPGWDQGRRRA